MASRNKDLWDREALALLRALTSLRTTREAKRFIRDLMTEDEIRMIVDRWRVARMLHAGRSYREIAERTGLSSRTIARVSRRLNHWQRRRNHQRNPNANRYSNPTKPE